MNKITMLRIYLVTGLFCFLFSGVMQGQQLSLQECIRIAEDNSLSLKNQQLNVESAKVSQKLSRSQVIPSLNASTNFGYNFGFAIDPTTNDFSNQTSSILNGGLNAEVNLFQFGRVNEEKTVGNLNLLASQTDWKQEKRNISLLVANAYLQAVLQKELLQNANRNLALSQAQVDRIQKMLSAGAVSEAELFNIEAQEARDEQALINAENNYQSSLLQLKLLMQYQEDFDPVVPSDEELQVNDPYQAMTLEMILNSAIDNDFRIEAAKLRETISQHQISINRKSMLPSLSLFGNANTRYSSLAQRIGGTETRSVSTDFSINGQPVTAVQEVDFLKFEDAPVDYQLRNNFGQFVGVAMNVPIYNQYRLQSQVDEAKITRERNAINLQTSMQQIQEEVNQAYQNYSNSKSSLKAAEKSYEAMERSFLNSEKGFELGAVNNFEYNQSRIQRDNSENDRIRAKYNYIFSIKVLDYYMGINLNDE